MRDFFKLTKDEFLSSYNYLNEKDYDETKKIVDKSVILELTYEGKDNWERPVYKSKTGVRYKDVELVQGKVNYQQNEDKITKLSILKDLKQNIEHNIFCYSANYLMTQPKKEYVNEWKAENKKLQIVEEMIKEEKQNVKNKNKDKSL